MEEAGDSGVVLRLCTNQYLLEEDHTVLAKLVLGEDISTRGNPERNVIHSLCCLQELLGSL